MKGDKGSADSTSIAGIGKICADWPICRICGKTTGLRRLCQSVVSLVRDHIHAPAKTFVDMVLEDVTELYLGSPFPSVRFVIDEPEKRLQWDKCEIVEDLVERK